MRSVANAGWYLVSRRPKETGRWRLRESLVSSDHRGDHPRRSPSPRVDPVLQETFFQLRDTWLQQTAHLSSLTARVLHPAYQRIIGLGRAVLPLLLGELEQRPAQWMWALRSITGEDPIAPEDRGALRKEREAWLAWGHRNGLV